MISCNFKVVHLHGIGDCVGKALTKSERLNKRQLELRHVGRVLYAAQVPVQCTSHSVQTHSGEMHLEIAVFEKTCFFDLNWPK